MARRFALLVLLAAAMLPALLQGTQAAPVPVRPYALRDIPVGMTLTDFRRVRHPDVAAPAGTRIVCSQDEGAHGLESLTLSTTMLQADTVKCGFFHPEPAADGQRLVPSPMTFLGEQVSPLFLFSKPEGARDYALTQITFGMSNRRANEIIGLFYRAFGAVTTLDVIRVQTSFGTSMPNIRYVWRNDVSSVELDSLSFMLTEMSVIFADNRLWNDLSERLATIDRMSRVAGQEEQRRKAAEQARDVEALTAKPPADAPPASQ